MPYGIPHEDPSIGVKITTFLWVGYRRQASEVGLHPQPGVDRCGIRGFAQQYIPDAAGPLPGYPPLPLHPHPRKHFIVDQHPHHPQVVIGAGFSGHGFKFTTLMGKMLAGPPPPPPWR